jgi:8-oxo-dGTP pyrophosphatase MutT (NUDIX family)
MLRHGSRDGLKMQPGRSPLRFFTESDLTPHDQPMGLATSFTTLLSEDERADLKDFATSFARSGEVTLSRSRLAGKAHLRTFIATCTALGALSMSEDATSVRVAGRGRLARHLPEILQMYVAERFRVIDDWNRTHLIPEDRLSAVELLQQMELSRIEQTLRSGRRPMPLAERPVAFAIFRALNAKGESCYLFEINKDWHRLNFIGGKQEREDRQSYSETVLREISEELGISAERLRLTRLNEQPIVGYSLSGNAGSLARYPCVLFGVTVEGELHTRVQDRWVTESAIRSCLELRDSPIMVNPSYLSFLLEGQPSRLSQCPLSTQDRVESADIRETLPARETVMSRWSRVLRENKDLVAAVLTLMAAVLAVVGVVRP